ncbi:Uncharacterised protein [Klebsiella pneumoniae]|nr:Uncharacterised protein [Klebsiella pneumoniae]
MSVFSNKVRLFSECIKIMYEILFIFIIGKLLVYF